MKNKLFSSIMLSIILSSILSVNVFAVELSCNSVKSGLGQYLQESSYGLETSDWSCDKTDTFKYPLKISFPQAMTCTVSYSDQGVRSDTKVTENDSIYGATSYTITDGKEILTDCSTSQSVAYGHEIGETSYSGSKKISYVPGYTIIYADKQLQMSDVDISISDGKVNVTGLISDDTAGWNIVFEKYKTVITGITGLCVLTSLVVFIFLCIHLGATAGNPTERKKVMVGILVSGIGTVALGAVVIFFGYFWNLL